MGGRAVLPPARSVVATVSFAVDHLGVISSAAWHTDDAGTRDLTGHRLLELVGPSDRTELIRLFLAATSTGAAARALVSADLGDGLQPVSITVEDRRGELGVLVRILRLTEAAEELEALAQLAFWDPLTGLANRALFGEHLRHELDRGRRSGQHPAVVFADVNALKAVNDELGHRTGDALLVEVGRRLRGACRPSDVAARMSGDEYAVLCPDVDSVSAARHLVDRLRRAVDGPADLCGHHVDIAVSLGWSLGTAEDHADGGALLLHRADTAMYSVKRFGVSA